MALTRQRHDASQASHARKQLRGSRYQRFRVLAMFSQALADGLYLLVFDRLKFQKRVNEKTITLIRWNTAGGGMRRGDKAEFFEIRHDVANGRSAELESEIPRECPRADRLAITDVV